MYSAVFSKQWPEVRDRIWTYPIVAATLTVLMLAPDLMSFIISVILVGVFLAADMAVQLGGDDVRYNSFEFIFTRPINRRSYFTAKFLFGLVPITGIVVSQFILEAIRFRELFWCLVSEPIEPTRPFGWNDLIVLGEYGLVLVAALFLTYSIVHFMCSMTRSESSFSAFIILGVIAAGVYTYCAAFLVNRWIPLDNTGVTEAGAPPLPILLVLTLIVFLIVPGAVFFLIARERYAGCELPLSVKSGTGTSSAGFWLFFVIIFVLLLALLSFFLVRGEKVPSEKEQSENRHRLEELRQNELPVNGGKGNE